MFNARNPDWLTNLRQREYDLQGQLVSYSIKSRQNYSICSLLLDIIRRDTLIVKIKINIIILLYYPY